MTVETRLTDIDDGTTQVIEVTTGPRGPVMDFITGSTPPTQEVGHPGDMYLISTGNSDIGDLYKKSIGGWELKGNIRGPVLVNSVNSKTGAVVITAPDITTGKFGIGVIPTGNTATTVALGNHTHAGVYEPVISSGTTSQYLRGDKTWSNPGLVDVEKTATTPATEYSPGVYVQPIAQSGEWPGTFGTVLTAIHGLDRGFQLFFAKDALPPKIRSSDSGPAGAGIGWRSWMTLADNDTVVHRSGNETIAGTKTLSSAPVVPDNSFTIAKVNGLQAGLNAKANTTHAHSAADITSGNISIERLLPSVNNSLLRTNLGLPTLWEAALIPAQMENKFQFRPPNQIEESPDGGATWSPSSHTPTSTAVKNMFLGRGVSHVSFPYGNQFRMTWNAWSYLNVAHLYIYWSANGHTAKIVVEVSNDLSSWTTMVDTNSSGGWPAHAYVSHNPIWINPAPAGGNQYKHIRLTIVPTWNATYVPPSPYANFTLYKMEWIGGYPASIGRDIFTWDFDKNAAFPATITSAGKAVVLTDDPRLSDARTPTSHNHDTRYYTKAEVDALIAAALNG